jgi:hypothetical protein
VSRAAAEHGDDGVSRREREDGEEAAFLVHAGLAAAGERAYTEDAHGF